MRQAGEGKAGLPVFEEFWILDEKAALCPVHGGPQLPLVLYQLGIAALGKPRSRVKNI